MSNKTQSEKEQNKHTGLPWKIDSRGTSIEKADFQVVANCEWNSAAEDYCSAPKSLEDAQDNARFILKCVNSHAILVEALEDAKQVAADYSGRTALSNEMWATTEGELPIGHISRLYLRLEQALREVNQGAEVGNG